jgi:hypothetical protein
MYENSAPGRTARWPAAKASPCGREPSHFRTRPRCWAATVRWFRRRCARPSSRFAKVPKGQFYTNYHTYVEWCRFGYACVCAIAIIAFNFSAFLGGGTSAFFYWASLNLITKEIFMPHCTVFGGK